jgi:hypothetical protein
MIKKEEIPMLNQLVVSLEENLENLENFYEKKDFENFSKIKKLMVSIQNKILDLAR